VLSPTYWSNSYETNCEYNYGTSPPKKNVYEEEEEEEEKREEERQKYYVNQNEDNQCVLEYYPRVESADVGNQICGTGDVFITHGEA
jgi:hypothetical protein